MRPNLTLALLSAALTAALFLLVLLVVEGWGRSPATAALTVSVVPVAALAARPLARLLRPPAEVEVAVGCFLIAGGLTGLAILPSADLIWTIAPQALVGLGLGLTIDRLTSQAMRMRLPRVEHAGWTISARHVGVVVGLAIMTPVFTADLRDAEAPAQEAIASLVLDAPLTAQTKIDLAKALGRELWQQQGQVPDLHRAFATSSSIPTSEPPRPSSSATSMPSWRPPRHAPSATRSSSAPVLPLLALLTVIAPRRRTTHMTGRPPLATLPAVALALVAGVLGVQLANGGGTFEPLESADPCVERTVTSQSEGIEGLTERLVLIGIDGAACRLNVSREALTLELAQPGPRTDAEVDALRQGLLSAVQRMEDDGSLPPASELVDEALESADLSDFVKTLIRALPDSLVNAAVKTDDVLTRTINDLDLRALLANLDDQNDLNQQVEAAVTQAVKDSLAARLRDLL